MNCFQKVFLLIIFAISFAQISVTASVDSRNIQKDDIFTYQISIENADDVPNFQLPKMTDFSIVSGPNQSSSFQWINGKQSSSVTLSWQLSPKKNGKLTIPSFSLSIDGKSYKTQAFSISVSDKPNKNKTGQGKDIFLELALDKTDIFIGEQITGTLNLYSKVDVSGYEFTAEPAAVGFLKEEISKPRRPQGRRTHINGIAYSVFPMMEIAFFPTRTGELIIDEYEMQLSIKVRTKSRKRSIFNDPFFSNSMTQTKILRTKPQKISVKQTLENGKPKSFNGLVGQFNLDTEIDRTEIAENEAFRLTMTISGKGNWRSAEIPKPIFPAGFDVFDPKISDNVRYSNGVLRGSKIYEFVVIPRTSGEFTIPAQEISYFDPNQKKYRIKRTKLFQISVTPSDGLVSSGTFSPEEVEILSQDIRFIHLDTDLRKRNQKQSSFWLLNALICFALFGGFAMQFRQKQSANLNWQTERKRRNALRTFEKNLKIAQKKNKSGDLDSVFNLSAMAIRTYFREKLQISEHETDSENLKAKLGDSAIDILQILEKLEAGRFAPGIPTKTADLDKLMTNLKTMLQEMDEKL